jgi:hypothetical protein
MPFIHITDLMSMSFFLGAYWPARCESIEQCADRLQGCFAGLSICDPVLATWYELGQSRKQALQKRADAGSRDYLIAMLNSGRNRRDIGKTVIEELGFHIGVWNGGADGKESGLGITCGQYSTAPGLGSNCVNLDLPERLGDLERAEHMARVLEVVAESWEPDWAGVMSGAAMDARDFTARKPFVDWMLYLSNGLVFPIPELLRPAKVQHVGKIGSIIVVQPEPPDPANCQHLRNIQQVEKVLWPSEV